MPLIGTHKLRSLAFAPASATLVPMFKGQRGHPVRFAKNCQSKLRKLSDKKAEAGLFNALSASLSIAIINLDDPGVVTDIDTLDDLQQAELLLKTRWP